MTTEQECPICYNTIGTNNCCITECGHSFCLKCILSATQNNHRCPFCRTEILDLENHNNNNEDDDDDEDELDNEEEDGENIMYKVEIPKLSERMREKEYTFDDLLAVIAESKFYSIENHSGKYTEEFFDQFHNEMEEIIECDLYERENYEKELLLMRKEDVRLL
jgi:hypothetical protein